MYSTRPERCQQKMAYSAECVARTAALALSWVAVGLKLYPYQCDVCSYWHLTHYEQPATLPVQRSVSVIH